MPAQICYGFIVFVALGGAAESKRVRSRLRTHRTGQSPSFVEVGSSKSQDHVNAMWQPQNALACLLLLTNPATAFYFDGKAVLGGSRPLANRVRIASGSRGAAKVAMVGPETVTPRIMAELSEPTRPQNSYLIWLSEHRAELTKEAGDAKGSVVSKFAGEKWKALPANAKAPYEKQAAVKRAAYEKAMEEFKAAGGQVGKRRQEKAVGKKDRADKKAKKEARKQSGAPKRPLTVYVMWLNAEGREATQKELGTTDFGPVTKAAAKKWKNIPAATKAKYERIAAEAKAEYEKAFKEWKATQCNKEHVDNNDEDDEDEY